MEQELDALATWNLIDPPKGKNCIGCKWLYKMKCNFDGSTESYKARLVTKVYA